MIREGAGGDPLIAAVEAIYGAAAAPAGWPAALAAIAGVFDDVGASLTYRRDDGRFVAIVSPSLAAAADDYGGQWHRLDIRTTRADECGFFAFRDVITDEHLVSADEMASHPFYTKFLAKFGLRWSASVNISPDPHTVCIVSVQRSSEKRAFSRAEQLLLLRLGRHVENALRLGGQLIGREMADGGLRGALAGLAGGIFLLDRRGVVIFSNSAGNRLLGDGLALTNARITASSLRKRPEFDSAIEAALRAGPGGAIADPRPILLPRPSSERPIVGFVLPMRAGASAGSDELLARAQAIVIVIESGGQGLTDPALLRDLLGLTLGEARVAALAASGLPPGEASRRLRIPEKTTRRVLERVLTKTGVGCQTKLMAVLERAAEAA